MRKRFQGRALKFPISDKFLPEEGTDLILQDIQLLILTRPGERVMRPEFGCNLTSRIWDNLDTVAEIGASDIAESIRRFEPRVVLLEVVPSINRNSGLIFFKIRMLIRDGSVETNLVFPFKPASELSRR